MDEPVDLAPLWESAIAAYEKETKHELSPNLLAALRSVDSSEELLRQIEASGQAFADFRHKRKKVWGTLKRFVAPLAAVLKIALTPASVGNGFGIPASAAIGACLYLVKSCENVSQAYDWIEEVLTELQEFTERLNEYSKSEIGAVLQKKIVAILSFILRVIGRSEALIREHRFRLYLHVTLLGKDEKTKQLVDELNQLFGSEQRFVLAVTYATAQRTDATTQRIEEKVANIEGIQTTIKEHVAREESAQVNARIRHLLHSTSAADDVEETFVRNKRSLLKGTGAWLQRESLFKSWIEQDATILWIFGLPGAGKSYLSTWLASQLLDRLEHKRKEHCVAYFFVKENNELLRDANNILKTLAWQLTEQDVHFKEHIAEVSKQRKLTITPEDTWENIFLGYYGNADMNPKFASIVIDGLDEATALTRRTLLGLMKDFLSATRVSSRPMIQFAVIGRTSLRNDVEFTRQERIHVIEVSKEKNRADMDSYVCKRLEEVDVLREMRKIKPGGLKRANRTGAAIRTKILDNADGVFLWAKLLIETIIHKDLPQIESILKDPPGDLDDMIWSVFDRLARDEELDHELIKKMLLLCGYARTPLKFGELDLFLSLPGGKQNLLLWKHIRGKLSSVFELKYPRGFSPDEVEAADSELKGSGGVSAVENDEFDPNAGGFDFSGDIDNDESDDEKSLASDDDDIFSPDVDRTLRSKQSLELLRTDSAMRHLSNGQLNTYVAFCHSRIKDYIVREGSSDRRKQYCIIIPVANEAQLQLTLNCLDVLRLELSLKEETAYLANYALRNLAQHLLETDRTLVPNRDFCRIVEGLHWLLGTERGAECFLRPLDSYGWREFYDLWVARKKPLQVIQGWLQEVETRNGLGPIINLEAYEWARFAATTYQNLLKVWMTYASKRWLVRPGYDSGEYAYKGESACWMLDGWLTLIETSQVKYTNETESPSRLEHLANWAGLKHDTHWHTNLAWLMMHYRFVNEAFDHCKKAIALDSHAWVAMECLARVYGDIKNSPKYEKAIAWQTKAIETVPERMKWIVRYLWPRIADWNALLGNADLAYDAALKGWLLDYTICDVRFQYLKALYRKGNTSKFLWTLKWLHEQYVDEERTESRLVEFLKAGYDIFEDMGDACREEGQPEWIIDALDQTIRIADQRDWLWIKVSLPLRIARFGFTYYDGHQTRFIKTAEDFLERLDRQSSSFQQDFANDRKWIVNKLAQYYFDTAVSLYETAGEITPEATVAADKLKRLAISVGTSSDPNYDGFDFFREDYPSLLWGRWLRDFKKADEKTWRKCFKVRLLAEMNALDDGDPANDTSGIASLAISLFHAGDRRDAAGLLAVLFKEIEDKQTANEQGQLEKLSATEIPNVTAALENITISADTEIQDRDANENQLQRHDSAEELHDAVEDESKSKPSQPGSGQDISFLKDGQETLLYINEGSGVYNCCNCSQNTLETKDMYFCEICLNVQWCGECLAKLRDPSLRLELGKHICNPNHVQYQVYPIPDEARNLAVEYLEAGVQLRKEWLANLREEWMKAGI